MNTRKPLDPRIRVSLYAGVVFAGALATTWGVVTQDLVDALLPTIGGLLVTAGGVTAVKNVNTAPAAADPSPVQEVVTQLPAILTALDDLRAAVNNLPSAQAATDALVAYVPDMAPWLEGVELEGERGGEHRLIE